MKTLILYFSLLSMGGMGWTDEPALTNRWNDALSSVAHRYRDDHRPSPIEPPLALGNIEVHPGKIYEGNAKPVELAHEIIMDHLRQIKNSGMMSNGIVDSHYWQVVFWKAGRPDLYETGQPELRKALNAGLKPYYEGETLEACQFADLAMKAINELDGPTEQETQDKIRLVP